MRFVPNNLTQNLIYFQSLYGRINVEVKTYSSKKMYKTQQTQIYVYWVYIHTTYDNEKYDCFFRLLKRYSNIVKIKRL